MKKLAVPFLLSASSAFAISLGIAVDPMGSAATATGWSYTQPGVARYMSTTAGASSFVVNNTIEPGRWGMYATNSSGSTQTYYLNYHFTASGGVSFIPDWNTASSTFFAPLQSSRGNYTISVYFTFLDASENSAYLNFTLPADYTSPLAMLSDAGNGFDWAHVTDTHETFYLQAGQSMTAALDYAYLTAGFFNPPTPPVPEPSTYGLALGGLALVSAVIRRRRK